MLLKFYIPRARKECLKKGRRTLGSCLVGPEWAAAHGPRPTGCPSLVYFEDDLYIKNTFMLCCSRTLCQCSCFVIIHILFVLYSCLFLCLCSRTVFPGRARFQSKRDSTREESDCNIYTLMINFTKYESH